MPQAKLIKVEQTEEGIRLTFLDANNEEISGIYDNAVLSKEKLEQMIGYHISFADKKDNISISKAWNREGKPSFSINEGYDR